MDSSKLEDVATRVAALERHCRRLTGCVALLLLVLAIVGLAQWTDVARAAQAEPRGVASPAASLPPDGSLTLRELVIADARGTPRVRIAAPLPEPIMLGKRFRRGDPVSGVLLYDAEGNERGGYVTGEESRDAALTLDEINRAAVHIGVNDRGEMHMMLSNGHGGFAGLGVLPDGGFLRIERDGTPPLLLPEAAKGSGK